MAQRYNTKLYDFTLPANGSQTIMAIGEYFRIQSATGALTVEVEGYGKLPGLLVGQGLQRTPYTRLVLTDTSGAANAGTILCSGSEFVDNRTYGVNSLDTATIISLKLPTPRPEIYTNWYQTQAPFLANTAETVFSAAANVNGVIVQSLTSMNYGAFGSVETFLAKSTAPINFLDGTIIALSQATLSNMSTNNYTVINCEKDIFIPAGQGLFFIANSASNATFGLLRTVRFKVL